MEKVFKDGSPLGSKAVLIKKTHEQKKQELLLKLIKEKTRKTSTLITHANRDEVLPLSWAQQQLWLVSQLDDQSDRAYHIPTVLNLKGFLDKNALESAFSILVARHEILRTNIRVNENGEAYQYIHPDMEFNVSFHVLPNDSSSAKGKNLYQELIDTAISKPFDLAVDSLFRVSLISQGACSHTLVIVMHHIITDAWSMGILNRELSTLYHAIKIGNANPLTELPIQYADYAVWQRDFLTTDVVDRETKYWRERLHSVTPLELATDRSRPLKKSYKGASVKLDIDYELSLELNSLGKKHGCTVFMTLLAVFYTLLHRYTQQTDICIGSPVANRLQSETRSLIGYFVNILALRISVDGFQSFEDLLKQVKAVALSAYQHQSLPFEQVVRSVNPQRAQAYSTLFQVMLVLRNIDGGGLVMHDLAVEYEYIPNVKSMFDLTLVFDEMKDGKLNGTLEYSTDLFDESTIFRLSQHIVQIMKEVIKYPGLALNQIDLIPESEKHKLLFEWNDTAVPFPKEKCIQEIFEQQVLATPDAVAIESGGENLTYDMLNTKANQLAHYLVNDCFIRPDVLVGICVERSAEMIVAILAIWKAGGAYVALDANYPQARLEYILRESSLATVITQVHLKEKIKLADAIAVCIDDFHFQVKLNLFSKKNISLKELGLSSSHLAYVMYTSGSTGKPKGVMVEHRSVHNLLIAICKMNLAGVIKWGLCASYAFDGSIKAFSALISGGYIRVIPESLKTDVSKLCSHLIDLNVMDTTPSLLEIWYQSNLFNLFPNLVVGGELISQDLWNKLLDWSIIHNKKIINVYGPTEATVDATWMEITYGKSSIGKPIQNVQLYILDNFQKLVPIGCVGELYIGGAGLARGYFNNSKLTEEKFILNPYFDSTNPVSCERLYRTGDICRYLENGNVEFWGRTDHQVKIRGFRIELEEIESTLKSHQSVHNTIVIAQKNEAGEKQIIAFVASDFELSPSELKEYIGCQLPHYMVPSAFVVMRTLPLTANGKIDRKALESIDVEFGAMARYVAPCTKIEYQMLQIWSEVLGRDAGSIGVYDNFFDLGGHSLLAIRAVIKIRDEFKRSLSVKEFFESSTIYGLCRILENTSIEHQFTPIKIVPKRSQALTSFAQERLWFLDQLDGAGNSYLVPAIYLLSGQLSISALKQAFESLLERHEVLRTSIRINEQGKPCQIIHEKAANKLALYSLIASNLDEEIEFIHDSDLLLKEIVFEPFKVDRDNLIRMALIELARGQYKLIIVMHHIITDGWSMSIFMRELSELYVAYSQGLENPLLPLALQYADYSIWQREYFQGEVFDEHSHYWKSHLKQIPILALPSDRPRPPIPSYKGNWLQFSVPSNVVSKLKIVGQSEGCTLFMALLSVFNVLLHRYTNQQTICVGTPIANRLQSEVEPLIGLFTNTLALRVDVNSETTFSELLRQIREITLEAYKHQLMPFEKVVDIVEPLRSQAYSPLFQVMFVLQNLKDADLWLPEVTVEQEWLDMQTSKFDLTLSLTEMADGSLCGGFEYATDLFDKTTVERLFTHFLSLMNILSLFPAEAIGKVDYLTDIERHNILVEWNNRDKKFSKEKCIQELFELQASNTPYAIAIESCNEKLTYNELNSKANQLANYLLRHRQIQPDVLIGVCLEPSAEMIVTILAILKAGGAYVVLNPQLAFKKLKYLLEDTSLGTLITQLNLRDKVDLDDTLVVIIDECLVKTEILKMPKCDIAPATIALTSSNLAYVTYTSGLVEKPKGISIEHKSLVNLSSSKKSLYKLNVNDKLLQFSNANFDISIENVFSIIISGGTLVLANVQQLHPGDFIDFCNKYSVTVLEIPAEYFHLLGTAITDSSVPSLRHVSVCGEGDYNLDENMSCENDCNISFANTYGFSETTGNAIIHWFADRMNRNGRVIGKPLPNYSLFVLDANQNIVPVGVLGELHIGGVGLARGYFKKPTLTTENFILNPFYNEVQSSSSERLYKTGNLCRYRSDGSVELMGRVDAQLKIRGFTVELGQIENVLAQHVSVKNSVVLPCESQNNKLIAFIEANVTFNGSELKDYLNRYFPDYMIPSDFISVDSIPYKENGKIDDQFLWSILDDHVNKRKSDSPSSKIEIKLIKLWEEVLNITGIGVEDDFFDLGGNSISLLQIIYNMEIMFKIKLSPGFIFRNKTIREIILRLDGLK